MGKLHADVQNNLAWHCIGGCGVLKGRVNSSGTCDLCTAKIAARRHADMPFCRMPAALEALSARRRRTRQCHQRSRRTLRVAHGRHTRVLVYCWCLFVYLLVRCVWCHVCRASASSPHAALVDYSVAEHRSSIRCVFGVSVVGQHEGRIASSMCVCVCLCVILRLRQPVLLPHFSSYIIVDSMWTIDAIFDVRSNRTQGQVVEMMPCFQTLGFVVVSSFSAVVLHGYLSAQHVCISTSGYYCLLCGAWVNGCVPDSLVSILRSKRKRCWFGVVRPNV